MRHGYGRVIAYAVAVNAVCAACDAPFLDDDEQVAVASNVRAFAHQTFTVWRCRTCRSIHARDAVDLDAYYADYPFARATASRVTRYFHGRLWKRIGAAPGARVLDYGCGAGLFVDELRRRGVDAVGYDAYAPRFADDRVLDARYDCVIAQDVIEHVDDPRALLATFERLCVPGGRIAIGTPDAGAIDLARADAWKHTLHQPYHRHLLSRAALEALAAARGWTLERYWPRPYTNSPIPTLNAPYLLRYLRAVDDTLDVAFEPPRVRAAMFTPAALFDAVFGALRCPPGDGLAIFRAPDLRP